MKISVISEVKNGKLIRNRNQLSEVIASYEGQEISITVEKRKIKRSNPQNRYLWGICYPILQNCLKESGNVFNIDMVHELMRLRFLKDVVMVNEDTGEILDRVKSTTELSTIEFNTYTDNIKQFALEFFNTVIPEPNSEIKLEL